jgi:hypothetical protein
MNREQRIGLAVLAGMAMGAGALLWLAVATDRLPDGGVLIALGAVVIAGAAQIPIFLANRRRGQCTNAASLGRGSPDARS